MNGLRAILFDFGGTLDGPGEPWVDRFARAYQHAGLAVTADALRAAAGYGTRQAYHTPGVSRFSLRETVTFHVTCQFAQLQIENPAAAAAVVADFLDRSERALAASHAVLARLAERFRLGVVSNFYGNVARLLADAGFAPLLAAVIDSTVVGISKPDPRIFALAAERLEVSPSATLAVGDSLDQDMIPARSAGLRTAWLTRGGGAAPTSVDLQLADLAELERLI